MFSLRNKRILYFGSNNGIDISIKNKISKLGGQFIEYDDLCIGKIEKDFKLLIDRHGKFDGMIFGIVHSDFRPLKFTTPEKVAEIMNDNYCLFVEAVRVLKKYRGLNKNSSIVVLSSVSSFKGIKAKMAFCSAKAALDSAVRCLASELSSKGIRVNSIQKGGVDTDYTKYHIKEIVNLNDGETEKRQPLGLTKAEEISNLACFMLSDAVVTMTGTAIVLDGGYSL